MKERRKNTKMLERVKEGRWEREKEESSTVQIGGKPQKHPRLLWPLPGGENGM